MTRVRSPDRRRGSGRSSASARRCAPANDTPNRSARPKSSRLTPELVVERRREGREDAAAAVDVGADGRALRVGERRRVGEDQQLERDRAGRREKRLVHELERHARLDERVVHAEHVVGGAVARGDARVKRRGLLGDAAARRARAASRCAGSARACSATGRCARRSAASGGRRARRRTSSPTAACRSRCLRPPRGGSPARSARSPSSDTRSSRPTLKMPPIGRRPMTDRILLGAAAVRPRRRDAAARLIVGELNRRQLARRLQVGRAVGNEARLRVDGADRRVQCFHSSVSRALRHSRNWRRAGSRASVARQLEPGRRLEVRLAVDAVAIALRRPPVGEDAVDLVAA